MDPFYAMTMKLQFGCDILVKEQRVVYIPKHF